MKEQGVTAVEMEDLLGVLRGTFLNWILGKGKSYYKHIDKIADRLSVIINYLSGGKAIKSDALSSWEMEPIERFRYLMDEVKKVMIKKVRLLVRE